MIYHRECHECELGVVSLDMPNTCVHSKAGVDDLVAFEKSWFSLFGHYTAFDADLDDSAHAEDGLNRLSWSHSAPK